MSAAAEAIIGAGFGVLGAMIVALFGRVEDMRVRVGRLEEWVRQQERALNNRPHA